MKMMSSASRSNHFLLRAIIGALFYFTTGLTPSWAQTKIDDIALSSDAMERDDTVGQILLQGNVQLIFGGYHLSADEAQILYNEKLINAKGNVVLQNQGTYSEGDNLHFNYETNKGILSNGFVKSGQVIFEGKRIEKTGENTYLVDDANFTACTTCPAAWSFSGSQIEAEIGGYAWIKYPIMRLANFPIFTFFGIVVPLKSTRQSGFLVPEFESSDTGGEAISESYFWAIDRSKDLTITAKHYSNRGWKALGDFRYVLDQDSYGQLKGAYLYDRAFTNIAGNPAAIGRGYMQYQHYYLLPNDYVQRMNFIYMSDLRYHRDFHQEVGTQGPALENGASITRNLEKQHFSAEAGLYRNLLKDNPFAQNDDAVHRLPEIRYSLVDHPINDSDVFINFDFNYVNFARQTLSYDDVELTPANLSQPKKITTQKDGVFDPDQDLIRSGHRMILSPGLSYPIHLGQVAELIPQISYHESQYFFNAKTDDPTKDYSPSATRRHLQTDLALRTRFNKIFGDLKSKRGTTYKHVIEPEVSYSSIPWVRRPEHGFFGNFEDQPYSRREEPVTDQDFFGNSRLQFDYKDRLFNKNIVNFDITNRVIRKRWLGQGPTFDNIVRLKISQFYDLNQESGINPRPWSSLNILFDLTLDNFETVTTASYHPYAGATSTSSRVRFKNHVGDYLELSFDQNFNIDEDAEYQFEDRNENWGLKFGHVSKFFNLSARMDYSPKTHTFYKWSYLFQIKPPGDCWGFQFHQEKVFLGSTIQKYNFYFEFGGDSKKLYNF